jgi:hypothetical protein
MRRCPLRGGWVVVRKVKVLLEESEGDWLVHKAVDGSALREFDRHSMSFAVRPIIIAFMCQIPEADRTRRIALNVSKNFIPTSSRVADRVVLICGYSAGCDRAST